MKLPYFMRSLQSAAYFVLLVRLASLRRNWGYVAHTANIFSSRKLPKVRDAREILRGEL